MQKSFGPQEAAALRMTGLSGGALLLVGGDFFGYSLAKTIQRHLQAGFEIDSWFPAKKLASFRYVGTALLGIILRQRLVADFAFRSRHFNYALRAFENRELVRVADVNRQMFGGLR